MRKPTGWRSMVGVVGLALSCLAGGGLGARLAAAEEIKIPDNKDVWISAANSKEVDCNMGAASTMKLKVWQEYGMLDFDLSGLKGKQIKSAELFIYPLVERGQKRTPFHWMVLSTITSPWVEGQSESYGQDDKGHGATFNEASYKTRAWAWPGSKAFDVMLGNGNSLRAEVEISDAGDGWWKMPVPTAMVTSMVAGGSYGLMLMDGSTSVRQNNKIYQREQTGKGPYLLVQVEGTDKAAPAALAGVTIAAEPNRAAADSGAVRVKLTCPADAVALTIQVDGQDLPRYAIPQPKAGAMEFVLVDLPAAKAAEFTLGAVDGAGNAGPTTMVKATTSVAITVPKLPAPRWKPQGGAAPTAGNALKVWAIPELVKTDPATGATRFEGKEADYSQKNAVFDGATDTVRLSSARAEIASFQLVAQALGDSLTGVTVTVSDLKNGEETIAAAGVKLWRLWYVDGEAEYCIPLTGGCDIPAKDNKVAGQKTQQIIVDVFVPKATVPGLYKGAVTVAAGAETTIALPLEIQVYSAVIPDTLNFNPELNCYGGPGTAGTEVFFDYHRLAHYNRCTINRVPYSQSGRSHGDMAPKANEAGHVTDWSGYDAAVGPLLNGSAFKDNPRAGVPVRTFYLPQFEMWPLSWRGHYNPGPGATVPTPDTKDEGWKETHDTYAKPVADSFDAAYKKAWVTSIREFVEHFEKMGYTRTACELYLNNKYGSGKQSSLWTLDEPYEALDWHALKFYSELFHEGIKDVKRPDWFVYRGDISRPEWQGNIMDGWMEYMYCNSGAFGMSRLVVDTRRRSDMTLYIYGSANHPKRNDYESAAWCYKSLTIEGSGVLPWQSLGGAEKLQKLDDDSICALLVDGKQFGVSAVASMRVHALRRGAQDAELMLLLQQKQGWSRTHLDALISQKLVLGTNFKQMKSDDAAAVTFGELSSDKFAEIKDGVLQLLEQK